MQMIFQLAQVTGGQAVPAANGPISQKQQPVTLMQVRSFHRSYSTRPVAYIIYIICVLFVAT